MKMIKRVNKQKVDPDLMKAVLEEVAGEPVKRGFEGTTFEIFQRVSELGLPERQRTDLALAVSFRLQALARLMEDGGGRGWTLPGEPGCTFVHEELVRAAAEEPMIEVNNQVAFDPMSLHRRLLALAEMHGET